MPTQTLIITDTTFVSSAQPDNNFSFYPLLYVGTDPEYHNCIGFLQFALPSLPVNAVDSAVLQLSVIVKSGDAPSPIIVNRVTSSLDTNIVTYNSQPAFTATPSNINVSPSDLYTTVQIDVTTLVNQWLNGTYPNNGIALTNPDGTTIVQFGTDNIVYEPYFPRLVLTYSGTPSGNDTALCFSYAQLANVIRQIIDFYPTNFITVFLKGFSPSTVTGTPYQLYSSAEGTYGGLFVLLDNGQEEAIPLDAITAIYLGDGSVYNPSITYLPVPQFPAGCDTNLITAIHDYLPLSTDVQMYMGALVQASGSIYKNEYGLLVLSDADGNTPIFVPVLNITTILPATGGNTLKAGGRPTVTITNKT